MEHVRYVRPVTRRQILQDACTCGQRHEFRTWPTMELAAQDLALYVGRWVANDQVSRVCRDFAEQGTGIESLRAALSLNI